MELTTTVGLGFGLICIVISIMLNGQILSFYDLPAIFIVFGGTIASTVISYHARVLKTLVKVCKIAFKKNEHDLKKDIDLIIDVANIARKDGLLALEDAVESFESPFLKKGVMLVVDGADPELIKCILEAEIYFMQERHAQGQAVVDSMASYAPAFGMIGTLIGLINMLKTLSDPDSLGPAMAVALVTTFYGVVLANLVFLPISKKLKEVTAAETMEKEMLLEGLLSIQNGENPRIIRDKLNSFLSTREINEEQKNPSSVKPETEDVQDAKTEKA